MTEKKKKWPWLVLLLVLAAALAGIIYVRMGSEPEVMLRPETPKESFPVYAAGAALANTAEGEFTPADCLACADRETGLYMYTGALPEEDARLFARGDYLYALGGETLFCLDVRTGEQTGASLGTAQGEARSGERFAGTLDDGALWLVTAGETMALKIFSPACELRLDYARAASAGALWAVVSPGGERLVLGFEEKIQVFDLVRGELRERRCEAGALRDVVYGHDGRIYGALSDGNGTAALDIESGKVEMIERLGRAVPVSEDYAAGAADFDGTLTLLSLYEGGNTLHLPGEGASLERAALSAGMLLCADDIGRYGGAVRRLYNLADGSLIQWCREGESASASALSAEFGWGAYLSGGYLYIFPADRAAYGTGAEGAAYLGALPQDECGELAREVYNAAGIMLHWGAEGAAFPSESFAAEAAEEADCLQTMAGIARFVAKLPEGMVQEALAGVASELHIYVCKGLHTVPDLGWSTGGFTDIIDGKLCIVINTDDLYWIDGNIAHEFWHAAEYRIRILEQARAEDYTAAWAGLMEKEIGNVYWDNGLNKISSEWQQDGAYCADGGESEAERVWFVRAYSRSDPGEDRATVFEALNWSGEQGLFARYPHLREKAETLCELLRACYPSCSGAEPLAWELCLQNR